MFLYQRKCSGISFYSLFSSWEWHPQVISIIPRAVEVSLGKKLRMLQTIGKRTLFFLVYHVLMRVCSSFIDLLQNPDFESPPTNLSANATSFVLLKENNSIPGWTFEGTVLYVKASQNISLPENGHAIQLGQDGKINQTFTANGDIVTYLLTFTLALGGPVNCTANASLAISAPDSNAVFSVKQHFGKQTWQRYGHYLGSWGDGEPVDLVFESQTAESDPNSTCWPVIDTLQLQTIGSLPKANGKQIHNPDPA